MMVMVISPKVGIEQRFKPPLTTRKSIAALTGESKARMTSIPPRKDQTKVWVSMSRLAEAGNASRKLNPRWMPNLKRGP